MRTCVSIIMRLLQSPRHCSRKRGTCVYCPRCGEIYRLRELKQKALAESAEREGLKKRIAKMRKIFEGTG